MAKQYASYPDTVIDAAKSYAAVIKTTKGDVHVDLFAGEAPLAVNNFVFLARDGFYDGVSFHRVIGGFMAQGGDPTGTGSGGPGYKFPDEVSSHKVPHKHETGSLSMANAGPNTNGSQFFICYAPQPHLDGKHTVFGKVTSGMEAVQALKNGDKMTSVEITEA